MTKIEYLDFEKPIEDLVNNLQQAEELGRDGIEVKQTVTDLKKKLTNKKERDLFQANGLAKSADFTPSESSIYT